MKYAVLRDTDECEPHAGQPEGWGQGSERLWMVPNLLLLTLEGKKQRCSNLRKLRAGGEPESESTPRHSLLSCLGWGDFFQCLLATNVLLTSSADRSLSSDRKSGVN